MKPLQFTVPVTAEKTIMVQEDKIPHFYPHLHKHKEAQLVWIVKGQGTLIADNTMHLFEAGDIFLIAPNQAHVFKGSESDMPDATHDTIHTISVFYDPNGNLSRLLELPELMQLNGFLKEYKGGFKLATPYFRLVSQKMKLLKEANQLDRIFHFLSLLRIFCKMSPRPQSLSATPMFEKIGEREGVRMEHINNYIMLHYHRDVTLEEVAAEAHMTSQAFCRYFKKHTGVTFVTFLNQMRISEACKQLTVGKYNSISSVAYNSGFNSITNFNRVFKSIAGTSPKEYLDKYKKNLS